MAKKSTMRRGQMIAIAALFTSAVAPYVVSADTVTTTSTEVENTVAETSTYVEKNVDYTVTASMDGLADRLKTAMVGDVNLRVDTDGKMYAQIAFIKSSYGFVSFFDKNKDTLTPISTTGDAGTVSLVRVIEVPVDEKYQAVVGVNAPNFGGEHTLTFDLAHEKFDFGFDTSLPENNSYFKNWATNGDVVTLKDGKKVAYVTFEGHSYAVSTIYDGKDKTKAATVLASTGSATEKNLKRVVRLELDANNKATAFLDGGDRGSYTFTFDFTEKAPEVKFATVADLSNKATALNVEFKSTNAAQFWLANIAKAGLTNPTAKLIDGKIEVTFETVGAKSLTISQNGTNVPVTLSDNKATFTVASLEGLTVNGVFSTKDPSTGETSDSATSVTIEKAQVIAPVETPGASIPTTTDVKGKKATVTFKASSDALNSYFQKGFFNGIEIVEIDGQTYADLSIIEKSIGLQYNYIMADGTTAEVAEISGNRATQNGEYAGFNAIIRFPVVVSDNGAFTFKLDTFGGQPGTDSEAQYQFTFTGKIQNDVTVNYTDVKNADTLKYVQQLANWGALNLNLTKFNPGNDITRAQFALMIARTLDLKAKGSVAFKDVKKLKDAETKNAIQALYEAGVVNGKTKNTFAPNDKITRQQAALMIYRLMTKKLGYTATKTADDVNFNDADDIKGEEAKKAFAELQSAQIMSGTNGFINPSSKLKRSQMAKILVESLNKTGFEKQ